MRRLRTIVENQPGAVDVGLAALTVAHAWAAGRVPSISFPRLFHAVAAPDLASLQGVVAGLAALLSGFSGVVVMFGLTGEGARFRRMRVTGGAPLRRIWVGTAASALTAAFVCVAGALLSLIGVAGAAWLLELGLLVCAHAGLRQVWLLRQLAEVVGAGDEEEERQARVVPLDQIRRRG